MKNVSLLLVILMLGSNSIAQGTSGKGKPAATKSTNTYYSPVQESYYAGFEYELQTAFSEAQISSYKAGGSNFTVVEAGVSLSKIIKNNIQAGGEVHLFNSSGGSSSSYLEFMGFGVYNFDNDLKQSLYAKGGLGIQNVINDRGNNESKFALMLGLGKRLLVLEKFTYNPEARIVMVDGTTRFQVVLLNFSLLF